MSLQQIRAGTQLAGLAASQSGWVVVEAKNVSGDAGPLVFSSLSPGVFYRLHFSFRKSADGWTYFRFNGDTGSNYKWGWWGVRIETSVNTYSSSSSDTGIFMSGTAELGASVTAGHFSFTTDPSDSTIVILTDGSVWLRKTTPTYDPASFSGYYDGAANLSSMSVITTGGNFTGQAILTKLQ